MKRLSLRFLSFLISALMLGLLAACGGGGAGGGITPPPGGTRIQGLVQGYSDLAPIAGVVVQVYDAYGNVLAQGTTAANGIYDIAVPVTASRVTVTSASLAGLYYSNFYYLGEVYAANIAGCSAPLPTINPLETTYIPTLAFETRIGPPPPPPTGCR